MNVLIDSHCHLDFECFDHDRKQVIERCKRLGIDRIIIPGTQADAWQKQISLCENHPQLRFALGLHPYFLNAYRASHLEKLRTCLTNYSDKVVGLGEIGLDGVVDVDWSLQVSVFTQQLHIATEQNLPIILHHRETHNELIRILKKGKFTQGGIVHAFSGSLQQALSYIDLGFKVGVGGGITYQRANKTREAIKRLPLSSLVLETDSPDMPLMGRQGERNSPEYLPDIFKTLLALRDENKDELMLACTNNVCAALINV